MLQSLNSVIKVFEKSPRSCVDRERIWLIVSIDFLKSLQYERTQSQQQFGYKWICKPFLVVNEVIAVITVIAESIMLS